MKSDHGNCRPALNIIDRSSDHSQDITILRPWDQQVEQGINRMIYETLAKFKAFNVGWMDESGL